MDSTPRQRLRPAASAAPVRQPACQRLLVHVPPRRNWAPGVRGGFGPASRVGYTAIHADGSLSEGEAPLAELPKARSLELVFDRLDVFSACVDAPRLGEIRLRQALPNLLEERMLGDPADHHFASAPSREAPGPEDRRAEGAAPGQRLSVSAIDRTTLARVLEACQQARLQPRAAYSEIYLLPRPAAGRFALRLERDRALLRAGDDEGCVFDLQDESGAATLSLARAQFGIRELLVYESAGAGAGSGHAREALARLGLPVEAAPAPLDLVAAEEAVNLLQGAYAPAGGYGLAGRIIGRLARNGAWKAPLGWAAACLVIAVGGLNAYWFKLNAEFQGVRASMQHAFRDAFPNEPPVDELAQARRDVAALRARAGHASSDDFTALAAATARWLAAAPVGIVANLEYGGGSLKVGFRPGSVDNPALRNQLQARAQSQGLAVNFGADGSATLTPADAGGN
jgi:general secretion pathway protein L